MSGLNEAFEDLRNVIKNLNVYRSAYKKLNGETIEDKFGTFTVLSSSTRCYTIIENAKHVAVDCLPPYASYINLRNSDKNRVDLDTFPTAIVTKNNKSFCFGFIYAPNTFILPWEFFGLPYFLADKYSFLRGLYLNWTGSNVLGSPNWIYNTEHIDQTSGIQYATVDFDEGYNMQPMYLNRLYLSSATFSNLANKLGNVSNGNLYLGEKNIANLTAAQKSAIEAKGWTIL